MNHSTLCIGADVHLDEIVLCVVDKADGHKVIDRSRVTNRLAAGLAHKLRRWPLLRRPLAWAAHASRSAGKRLACCGSPSTAT